MTPYAFLVADNTFAISNTSVMLVPTCYVHIFPWQLSFLFRAYLATVPTNMVAYMWNTDRKAVFIKIIDVIEVVVAPQEPVMQTASPEPAIPYSDLPADPEPVIPDFEADATDPEPVSPDTLWPDDYDDAQVLQIIRMWSGFKVELITDAQLLTSLGFDYPDADMPDWVMTELEVLVVRGDVAVGEFVLALQYVLENF